MMAVGLGLLIVGGIYALTAYKPEKMTWVALLMGCALWAGAALVLLSLLKLVWRYLP